MTNSNLPDIYRKFFREDFDDEIEPMHTQSQRWTIDVQAEFRTEKPKALLTENKKLAEQKELVDDMMVDAAKFRSTHQ